MASLSVVWWKYRSKNSFYFEKKINNESNLGGLEVCRQLGILFSRCPWFDKNTDVGGTLCSNNLQITFDTITMIIVIIVITTITMMMTCFEQRQQQSCFLLHCAELGMETFLGSAGDCSFIIIIVVVILIIIVIDDNELSLFSLMIMMIYNYCWWW